MRFAYEVARPHCREVLHSMLVLEQVDKRDFRIVKVLPERVESSTLTVWGLLLCLCLLLLLQVPDCRGLAVRLIVGGDASSLLAKMVL